MQEDQKNTSFVVLRDASVEGVSERSPTTPPRRQLSNKLKVIIGVFASLVVGALLFLALYKPGGSASAKSVDSSAVNQGTPSVTTTSTESTAALLTTAVTTTDVVQATVSTTITTTTAAAAATGSASKYTDLTAEAYKWSNHFDHDFRSAG
ncbi:hypothetical protein HDU91_001759, partial [Kappamyces sp. JEL0680]